MPRPCRALCDRKRVGAISLLAPRNLLSYVTVTLGALAIASAIYVIVDLDRPLDGIFAVSSQPLRDALTQLGQ